MSTVIQSKMRDRSWRTFVTSAIGLPVTAGILFLGMMMTGGGHGTYGMWYFGLALSFLCWLLVMISVITGIIAWKRDSLVVWWLVPETLLFVVLTLLGVWGVGG